LNSARPCIPESGLAKGLRLYRDGQGGGETSAHPKGVHPFVK
jgi:hypothetical protein